MAEFDRRIGELPAAASVAEDALFAIEQDGTALKLTWALLRSFINRNVLHVVTEPVTGASDITSDFDETTGTLTLYVPAQLTDAYSRTETDALLASQRITADRVMVSETQTLADVLMYDEDLRQYLRLRSMSRETFDARVLAGRTEEGTMYFPRDYVAPQDAAEEAQT